MKLEFKHHTFDKYTFDTHSQGNLRPFYKPIKVVWPLGSNNLLRKGPYFLSNYYKWQLNNFDKTLAYSVFKFPFFFDHSKVLSYRVQASVINYNYDRDQKKYLMIFDVGSKIHKKISSLSFWNINYNKYNSSTVKFNKYSYNQIMASFSTKGEQLLIGPQNKGHHNYFKSLYWNINKVYPWYFNLTLNLLKQRVLFHRKQSIFQTDANYFLSNLYNQQLLKKKNFSRLAPLPFFLTTLSHTVYHSIFISSYHRMTRMNFSIRFFRYFYRIKQRANFWSKIVEDFWAKINKQSLFFELEKINLYNDISYNRFMESKLLLVFFTVFNCFWSGAAINLINMYYTNSFAQFLPRFEKDSIMAKGSIKSINKLFIQTYRYLSKQGVIYKKPKFLCETEIFLPAYRRWIVNPLSQTEYLFFHTIPINRYKTGLSLLTTSMKRPYHYDRNIPHHFSNLFKNLERLFSFIVHFLIKYYYNYCYFVPIITKKIDTILSRFFSQRQLLDKEIYNYNTLLLSTTRLKKKLFIKKDKKKIFIIVRKLQKGLKKKHLYFCLTKANIKFLVNNNIRRVYQYLPKIMLFNFIKKNKKVIKRMSKKSRKFFFIKLFYSYRKIVKKIYDGLSKLDKVVRLKRKETNLRFVTITNKESLQQLKSKQINKKIKK